MTCALAYSDAVESTSFVRCPPMPVVPRFATASKPIPQTYEPLKPVRARVNSWRRSGVSKGPVDLARRTAASTLFREQATAIHHREAACGLPEAAMAPFASPLVRRCIAEQTERGRSKEKDLSPFAMGNTIAWDGRRHRCWATAHLMSEHVGSSQSLANACATAVGQQLA